jgi:hypothetical protein
MGGTTTTTSAAFQISSSSSCNLRHATSSNDIVRQISNRRRRRRRGFCCNLPTTLKKAARSVSTTSFFQQPTPPPQLSMRMLPTLLSEVDLTTNTNLSLLWIQNTNVWVFIIGTIPFAWATVEFWRRIVTGEPFGTGTDSISFSFIGKDDAPQESRGRRILDKSALITAYLLFVLAFGIMAIVLYSVGSSAPPPTEFASTTLTTPTTIPL